MADDDLTEARRAVSARQKAIRDELAARADAELRAARPDRYDPADAPFLDDVRDTIAAEMPTSVARVMAAQVLVSQRESRATRAVNRFLKGLLGANGQYALPVDWHLFADEPVAILTPVMKDGELVTHRRERVALRAMSAVDWETFASTGRVEAQHRLDAEMSMYDAAEWIATKQGTASFATWAEAILPSPAREDAS